MSCSPSFAIRWLVPHLPDLKERAPQVQLQVSADDALREPLAGIVDACIRFGAGGYRGVRSERLCEERLIPVCSPLYAETIGIAEPADLERCQLLHDTALSEHVAHIGWREFFAELELDADSARGLHFSHSHLALDAATSGLGVALGRRTLIRAHLERGVLIAPVDRSVPSGLTYWLITPKGAASNPALAEFCEWLKEALGSPVAASKG